VLVVGHPTKPPVGEREPHLPALPGTFLREVTLPEPLGRRIGAVGILVVHPEEDLRRTVFEEPVLSGAPRVCSRCGKRSSYTTKPALRRV
jgi:hypothetical protein